jgi:hypothetical protein
MIQMCVPWTCAWRCCFFYSLSFLAAHPSYPPLLASPPPREQSKFTPLHAVMYEPVKKYSIVLIQLLLGAKGGLLGVWDVDFKGYSPLDHCWELECLLLRVEGLGFTGDEASDYRGYLNDLGAGEEPLAPQAWYASGLRSTEPPNGPQKPIAEYLHYVHNAMSILAKLIDCPTSVFEACAPGPGRCKAAYDAYVQQRYASEQERLIEEAARRDAERDAELRREREALEREASRALEREEEAGAAAEAQAQALRALASAANPSLAALGGDSATSTAAAAAASSISSSAYSSFKHRHLPNILVSLAYLGLLLITSIQGTRLWDISWH